MVFFHTPPTFPAHLRLCPLTAPSPALLHNPPQPSTRCTSSVSLPNSLKSHPRNTTHTTPCHCRSQLYPSGEEDGPATPESGSFDAPFGLFLHDLLDKAGIDVAHAKASRRNFLKDIENLSRDGMTMTATDSWPLDVARAALEVSAEDDALVSHSAVALPVDSYIERLNSMAMEFAGHHMPTGYTRPDAILDSLDNYFYGYKSFQRLPLKQLGDARGSYLNTVLTRRLGTPIILALIYSELLNILQSWGVINFSVEMELSSDPSQLPCPNVVSHDYHSSIKESGEVSKLSKCQETDRSLLATPQLLLVEILTTLKKAYWPWKLFNDSAEGTDFLRAANAANHGINLSLGTPLESLFAAPSNSRGAEFAYARVAAHRLQRGIWTGTSFGDMRRALAASERLVLLGFDKCEWRDYGILLYHCGLYKPAFKYLYEYHSLQDNPSTALPNTIEAQEIEALENLILRLRLILAEQSWNTSTSGSFLGESLADPW